MIRKKVLAVAILLLVCACETGPFELPPEHEGRAILTDAAVYTARPTGELMPPFVQFEFTLVATFFNATDRSLYLGRCDPESRAPMYSVELVEPNDSERSGYGGAWMCAAHDRQFRVGPGETRVDTLRIHGPNSWNTATREYHGLLEGVFRLRYLVRTSRGSGAAGAPDSLGVSNVFEIRVDR